MERFVTRDDLKEAFTEFEQRISQQHEARIQMISGHYSDVLRSNQDLRSDVCGSNKVISDKLDTLAVSIQPVLDALKVAVTLHAFLKWLGLPFTLVGFCLYWVWSKL